MYYIIFLVNGDRGLGGSPGGKFKPPRMDWGTAENIRSQADAELK